MFRIGEFSRFSRVSVKMLRHYDEIGLLKPARVDPLNNYRYYSASQLPRLQRLISLKDLGFRLEQIGVLLDGGLSADQLRGMLKLRRAELEGQMSEIARQLAQVDARLAQLEREEQLPNYEVVLRSISPQWVVSIRQPVSVSDATVGTLFEELETYVARFQARAPLPPLVLYHDPEYPEGSEDIEVAVPVLKGLPPDNRYSTRELPVQATMACLIHTGRYDGLPFAFSVLLDWIERNGYSIAGPTRELYLRFGADQKGYLLPDAFVTENAAEFVTELQIPVASTSVE